MRLILRFFVVALVLGFAACSSDASDSSSNDDRPSAGEARPAAAARTRVVAQEDEIDAVGINDTLDSLAADCFDGDMEGCDELYRIAVDYFEYGLTCGGRIEPTDEWCVDVDPDELSDEPGPVPGEATPGDDNDSGGDETTTTGSDDETTTTGGDDETTTTGSDDETTTTGGDETTTTGGEDSTTTTIEVGVNDTLDALAAECHDGDLETCDALYLAAAEYFEYGLTCGGRIDETDEWCVDIDPDELSDEPGPPPGDVTTDPDDTTTTSSDETTTTGGGENGSGAFGHFRCSVFLNAGLSTVTREVTFDEDGTYEDFDPTGDTSRGTGEFVVEEDTGFLDFTDGPLVDTFARPRDATTWWITSEELRDDSTFDQNQKSEVCNPA